jgi:hypothetical protein
MRSQQIYIDAKLMRRLRAAADLLGYEGVDAVDALAYFWLTEKLAAMPEIELLMNEQGKLLSEHRKSWLAKHQQAPTE